MENNTNATLAPEKTDDRKAYQREYQRGYRRRKRGLDLSVYHKFADAVKAEGDFVTINIKLHKHFYKAFKVKLDEMQSNEQKFLEEFILKKVGYLK